MRLVLAALLLLAACGKKGAPDPAWPKSDAPETWEEDGGESIDPVRDTAIEDSETDGGEDGAVAVDAGAAEPAPGAIDGQDEMIIDDSDEPAPENPPPPED